MLKRWNRFQPLMPACWCVIGVIAFGGTVVAQAAASSDDASVHVETGKAEQARGATLLVNGKEIGPLPIKLSLQTGRYLLEVQKAEHEAWRRWLDIVGGQKLRLKVDLQPKATPVARERAKDTASLVVASDVFEAEVWVDGRSAGRVPALLSELDPGKHQVEVRAEGRAAYRQEVTLQAGQTLKLRVRLSPEAAPDTPAAEPSELAGDPESTPEAGGSEMDAPQTEAGVGSDTGNLVTETEDVPTPTAPQGTLRVESSVPGAAVRLGGEAIGQAPLEREVLAGVHVVTVRSARFEDFVASVEVKPGQVVTVRANPQPRTPKAPPLIEREAPVPADADYQATTRSLTSHTAYLVDPTFVTADFSSGFPYLVEARITTGFFDNGSLAMDGGVDLRTYGAITEAGLRARLRVLRHGPWALAVPMAIGGGGGAKARSTFFFDAGLLGSVVVAKWFNISVGTRMQIYSDRVCPSSSSANEMEACSVPPGGLTPTEVRQRFSGVRVLFSSNLEVPITHWMNLFGGIEFAPWQGNRRAYSNDFASIMPSSDPGFYGRLGLTIKR